MEHRKRFNYCMDCAFLQLEWSAKCHTFLFKRLSDGVVAIILHLHFTANSNHIVICNNYMVNHRSISGKMLFADNHARPKLNQNRCNQFPSSLQSLQPSTQCHENKVFQHPSCSLSDTNNEIRDKITFLLSKLLICVRKPSNTLIKFNIANYNSIRNG